jgi:hypothetical protein
MCEQWREEVGELLQHDVTQLVEWSGEVHLEMSLFSEQVRAGAEGLHAHPLQVL